MNRTVGGEIDSLAIEVQERPEIFEVHLRGNLDADSAPALSQAFEGWSAAGVARITLDLESVDFISSAGIGSLIAGVGESRDAGVTVEIVALSASVRHVLEMLELIEYLGCPTS